MNLTIRLPRHLRGLTKTLLLMKLTAIIMLATCLTASAEGFSQITLKEKNVPLQKVIKKIQKQSGLDFLYNFDLLQQQGNVNVELHNVSLQEALEACLKDKALTYSIVDNTVVIQPKKDNVEKTESVPLPPPPPIEIKGIVKDESGRPLQGASVGIKGKKTGTVTNEKGEFTITVADNSAILVISFVGMESIEVAVKGKSDFSITLKVGEIQQQEVVVVGYGTQKRQAITGSVVTADLKTYEKVPVNNIMETLKGTVAGLNVGEANTAGAVPGFTIRGRNTIAASQNPLIVLDGVIFSGSLADIPPSDIESVTVLKDASAVAVFGARSANGVIMIESKKGGGINGKPRFDFRTSYGVVNELKRLKVYDAQGYIKRLNDVLNDNGTVVALDQTPNYLQSGEKTNYDATSDHKPTLTDPYGPFRQTGFNSNTTISVSQRSDKTNYFLSGNYTSQKGVIKNDLYKHYTVRLNLESKVTNWLTLGIRSYYSYRDYPQDRIYGAGSGGSSPSLFSPYANLYNTDGSYNMYPQTTTSFINPFLVIASESYNRQNNFNGLLTGTVKVPWIKGLSYTMNYSRTLNMSETGAFYGLNTYVGLPAKGKGNRDYGRSNSLLVDHIVKYNNTFFKNHNIDITLLQTSQKNNSYGQYAEASGFDNDQLGTYRLQAGAIQTITTRGAKNENTGEMARLTYSYNKKYSFTGTIRKDGFSAFSANHKYVDNSSLGINWNVAGEKFMQKATWVNNLAARLSYGTNGNLSIDPYSTLSKISNGYYYYQGDGSYTYTQSVSTLGNDDLRPETLTGLNGGVDFSFFNNRFSGSIDGYLTKTNNLTFTLSLPAITGFTSITANAGEVRNKGIELNLRSLNIKNDKFNWRTEAAFSLNRNKVTHLLGDRNGDGKEDDIVSSGLFIGKSLGTVYDYRVIGMWQQSDKDNGTIMTGFLPGTYNLYDVNHDGKITSDSDRVFLGNTNANFRWSLTNTFTYGDFTLLVYLNSIWGGNNWFINGGNTPWNDGYANRGDLNHPIYDYWTPNNPYAEFPRPSYKDKTMAKAAKYYDRSFIRLQKVALSYEFTKYVKRWGVNGCNLSVSADNLGTYSPRWIGLDAATGSGLTVSSIPSLRTYTMNLSINF